VCSCCPTARRSKARVGADQRGIEAFEEDLKGLVFGEESDDDGIRLHDANHAALLDGHLDHPRQQQFPCLRTVFGRLRLFQRILQPGELHLCDSDDDLVLGLELVVHSRFRHAERVGDHLQRRTADTVIREQVQRGEQNAGLCCAARGRGEPSDRSRVTLPRLANRLRKLAESQRLHWQTFSAI
jgi:hypothetical protein